MNCSKCNGVLIESQRGPYTCKFCEECEGIWIPGNEISKILRSETSVESFEGIPVFSEGENQSLKNGNCPNCINTKLNVRSIKGVELDVCDTCNGIFFDKNELNNIFTKGLGSSLRSDELAYGSVEAAIQTFVALFKGLV
jgi:Zn-finger nucleic acid-binding protein